MAACLGLAAPHPAAGTELPASPAGGVEQARGLVDAGRFDEALALLRPLARARDAGTNVLFLTGFAAIGASKKRGVSANRREALLDEAIAIFRAILVGRPGLVRVRLELARAFFLKREDNLARKHFEQVLAGSPPAAVALNVNRFLRIMRARKRWNLRVGMALAPDTNIGSASKERFFHVFGLPLRRDAEELTTSGVGIRAWAGGEYQYPLGEGRRLRVGGDISRRDYRSREFDQTTVSGYVGPRWLVGKHGEVSLLLSGLQHWTGSGFEEPSHHHVGLRVEGKRRLNRRTTLNAELSWRERRYHKRKHFDGPITDISFDLQHVLSPTLRSNLSFGWGRERTKIESHRHARRWAQVGMTAQLPLGFTVGGSGALRWTHFEGDWSFYTQSPQRRRDLTRTIRVFAHNRALTFQGFSPQIALVQEQRTTNAQLYDYERLSGELRLVRLF